MAQRSSPRRPRSGGASRRPAGKKRSNGVPGWVWLVTGLLVGLFAAFLIFLLRFDMPQLATTADKGKTASEAKPRAAEKPKSAPAAKPAPKTESVAKKTPTPPPAAEKPALNYDFYKILPQYEVVVPEEEARKPAAATTSPGRYFLQVGAFRQMQEADGRKAELAMLGIVSSIQTVTIEVGNTWHRVRIGPVTDMRQLDRTKRQLQDNNIAFVTLKEKS